MSTHSLMDRIAEGSFLLLVGPLPAAAPWLAALPALVSPCLPLLPKQFIGICKRQPRDHPSLSLDENVS